MMKKAALVLVMSLVLAGGARARQPKPERRRQWTT